MAERSSSQTSEIPRKIEVVGLSKRFGAVQALSDVSVKLLPGHSLAVLGENGAGKSTLVKCMMGVYEPDSGRVFVDGRDLNLRDTRDAQRSGLGMVHQHFTLVDNMSVVENIVLAREAVPAIIDWKKETERFRAFMAETPFQIDPTSPVRDLAAGEKQKLEILKQLYNSRTVIILDEPTSVLTPQEADELLGKLNEWCQNGRLSMLLITHKLREVERYCDFVTVLRNGRVVGSRPVCELTQRQLIGMMVGTESIRTPSLQRTSMTTSDQSRRLEISNLSADNDRGVEVIRALSLTVNACEIVGIAGVSGNGQRDQDVSSLMANHTTGNVHRLKGIGSVFCRKCRSKTHVCRT